MASREGSLQPMKSLLKVVVFAICLLFVATIVLAGCGDDGSGTPDKEIVGQWVSLDKTIEMDFGADGVLTITVNGEEKQYQYSAQDGEIAVSDPETGEETTVDYHYDGDRLTVGAGLIPGEGVILTKS
jgi:hypothetical protein